MKAKEKKKRTLSEEEIDTIVIAQAGDNSAWGKPTRVHQGKQNGVGRGKRTE